MVKNNGETIETVTDFIFGAPKSLQMVTAALKLKDAYSLVQEPETVFDIEKVVKYSLKE